VTLAGPSLIDGRYRLQGLLGEGGMARVYEAEDLLFRRPVAIKVVKGVCSELRAERLFREATAAARTNHPVVVTIFAYGTDLDLGADYLVMERLRGESLQARLKRMGRLPPDFTLRVGVELADALSAAHDAGVVHRDIKPSNVFLSQQGLHVDHVKLLDFGIAKHLDLHTITEPDQLLGTVPYMAPEQLKDPRHADERTDVYALGVTLYECLAGVHPFRSPTIEGAATLIRLGLRKPLAEQAQEAPPALVAIVEQCLRSDARERFASARAMCEALQQIG
jgi:serine/threonine protein kinase